MRRCLALVIAATLLPSAARVASAQAPLWLDEGHPAPQVGATDDEIDRPLPTSWRWPRFLAEEFAVLAVPATYYFATTNLQREDFELAWDWPSWKTKLTSFDAVSLDTGNWTSNTFRHPLHGALAYQMARANGFTPIGSTVADVAVTIIWEYLVEYQEQVSLNDVVTNTAAGFLIGEPMFQIGFIGEDDGDDSAWLAVGALASPVHRLHVGTGVRSWRQRRNSWRRLEFELAGGAFAPGDGVRREARLGVEVDRLRAPHHTTPGTGTTRIRAAGWSSAAASVRVGADGLTNTRFDTLTDYVGWLTRTIDAEGRGTSWSIQVAGGFHYDTRQLDGGEWDRQAVFHLVGPRFTAGRWAGPQRYLALELAGYYDVGAIQAYGFGPTLPFAPLPQTAVLRTRGYYYGSGASVTARLRMAVPPWSLDLDGIAGQLWSIDGYDRFELDGGPDDPHGVTDTRARGRLTLGRAFTVAPWARLTLALEASLRRGTWQEYDRRQRDLGLEVGLAIER
ncbi:MAG: DUF3943 domain-containing protein [Myxococcales bacterium]|nr:DUF3943 domain-containing protein [Myxococcales bacterium]